MNQHAALPVPVSQTPAEQKVHQDAERLPAPGVDAEPEPSGSLDPRKSPTHPPRIRGTIKLKHPLLSQT